MIARNKETEITTAWDTLRKALKEKKMMEANVQFLWKFSKNLKRVLVDCKEELAYEKLHMDVEVKDRVYQGVGGETPPRVYRAVLLQGGAPSSGS